MQFIVTLYMCMQIIMTDVYVHMYLLLSLSHGKELETISSVAHPLSQLPQVSGRICTGTQDEHDRRLRRGLVVDVIKADNRRRDVLLPHPPGDKVGDGTVDAVDSEAAQQ